MPSATSIKEASRILGDSFVGPADAAFALGFASSLGDIPVPHSPQTLQTMRDAGEMLIWRYADVGATPLTIMELVRRQPTLVDARFLQKMGYQLKDEWGIELEPSASTATCTGGWGVVLKDVLKESLNVAYEAQDDFLAAYGKRIGSAVRRRTAVEITYDTLILWMTRQQRVLERTWDWSSTRTTDGGYLNIGGFSKNGLQIFSYSRAVRHGALGVCPARVTNE